MPKSPTALQRNPHIADVHSLGHPGAPPPQTRWVQPLHGQAAQPFVQPMHLPTIHIPNIVAAPTLAQGTGSALTVTWAVPTVDGAQRRRHL